MSTEPKSILYEGRFLSLIKEGRWEYAQRPRSIGAVAIVAVTEAGRLILIEQYRIPVARRVIELPAGLVGDRPGDEAEDLVTAARRELLEETGYEAGDFAYLTAGPPTAGLASEIVSFYRAAKLRKVGDADCDGHEQIQVHEVPLGEVDAWLKQREAEGAMIDPKVYTGLYFITAGK